MAFLVAALLIGVVAGLRAMAAPAIVSWAVVWAGFRPERVGPRLWAGITRRGFSRG